MWRPTTYREEDVAAFREAMADSPIDAVLIHAVYLLNCASEDPRHRAPSRSPRSPTRCASGTRSAPPAWCCIRARPRPATSPRRSPAPARRSGEALADSEGCDLHLENTAGAGGTLGRSIDELAALIEACGGDERVGLCLDSCHLYASGYDIGTNAGMDALMDEVSEKIGLERMGSLHLNDSQTTLGSNRDRHANVADGELGEEGCAAFLSAPQLRGARLRARDAGAGPQGRYC